MYKGLLLLITVVIWRKGYVQAASQPDIPLTNTSQALHENTATPNHNFSFPNNISTAQDVIAPLYKNPSNLQQTSHIEIINAANVSKAHKKRRRITPILFMVPRSTEQPDDDDVCSDSVEDFPPFLSPEQLAKGAVVVCFLIGIYCFTFLAVVCDKYFLPCVERICVALNLPQDVAAATFMSMATSAPEFFVNVIGTFITESDIGIGTVVGSNLYNTLGVAALGSLAASAPIQLDWWPVTRDCVIYICSVTLLVGVAWDGRIYWYEGLIMVIVFCLYLVVQFNSQTLSTYIKKWLGSRKISTENLTNNEIPSVPSPELIASTNSALVEAINIENKCVEDLKDKGAIGTIPKISWGSKLFYIYLWPIKTILSHIVPNPRTNPKFFPITFIFCVLLIGLNSYIVSWMLTLIGSTFGIPDAILGLTFLAAGGGLPESISIVIMSRRGEGSIGVSNALGANSVNILMSLGLPWFISTLTMGINKNSFVEIASGSIHYTIIGLLLVIFSLFITLYFNKFRLSRVIGVVLSAVYLVFLTLAVFSEMFFIRSVNC